MTGNYRYQLESKARKPRPKKEDCPYCGRRDHYTRFYDTKKQERLPVEYGACEGECVAPLNPYKDGYKERVEAREREQWLLENRAGYKPKMLSEPFKSSTETKLPRNKPNKAYFSTQVFLDTLGSYDDNAFLIAFKKQFGAVAANELAEKYLIGSYNDGFWQGSTTIPFIDINGNIHGVQVKKFDGFNTAKYMDKQGTQKSCTNWLNGILQKQHLKASTPVPEWLRLYQQNESKIDCLYGEWLLNLPENKNKPVALVEAPKSCWIADVFFKDFVWLAVGGLTYLTAERCKALTGRRVVLFPDIQGYDNWKGKIPALEGIVKNISISDYLEQNCTEEEKKRKLDIADYLLNSMRDDEPVVLTTDDIIHAPCFIMGTPEFGRLTMATIKTTKGNYDLWLTPEGELLQYGQAQKEVNDMATFFEKNIIKLQLDGVYGYGSIIN